MTLRSYLEKNHAPGTVKRYQREIDLFLCSIENPKTSNYDQLMDYLGKLRKHQKDIVPALCAIKQYYSYLVVIEEREDNPAISIKLRDKRPRSIQLQDLFKTEELALLLERKERYGILRNRNRIILSLLIYQGLTNGEIKRLVLRDINLEAGTIYINSSRKTNSRTLKLTNQQVFWLMNYQREDRPKLLRTVTAKLLINKSGSAESGEGISYLVERSKHLFPERKLNPKTIRQSVIANLLKAGKDLRVVQAFAGHKYPSATEQYKQNEVATLKAAVLKYHPLN